MNTNPHFSTPAIISSFSTKNFVMPGLTRHPVNNCFYWITHTIPGMRPAGQPAAVQIRSWRICPAFAGMTALLILMLKQNFLNIEIDIVARMKRSIIREINSWIPFHSIQATLGAW